MVQVWPEEDFPLQPVGVMRLDRNIDNFHNESEQIAFSPAIAVGGVSHGLIILPIQFALFQCNQQTHLEYKLRIQPTQHFWTFSACVITLAQAPSSAR